MEIDMKEISKKDNFMDKVFTNIICKIENIKENLLKIKKKEKVC